MLVQSCWALQAVSFTFVIAKKKEKKEVGRLFTFPSWFGQQRGFPAAAALTDSRTLQASGREHSGSRWRTW